MFWKKTSPSCGAGGLIGNEDWKREVRRGVERKGQEKKRGGDMFVCWEHTHTCRQTTRPADLIFASVFLLCRCVILLWVREDDVGDYERWSGEDR